ncbi:MAG: hypothetical protein GX284_12125 [Clostridiales bacterium]|nr:hypothetical protein [Clostridiales bacterium]
MGTESRILEELKETMPLFRQLATNDMHLALFSRTEVLGVWKADGFQIDFVQVGETLIASNPKHEFVLNAMANGSATEEEAPEEIFGIPVRGKLIPIYEDGQVVGLLTSLVSTKEKVRVGALTDSLDSNLIESLQSIEEIAQGATDLSEKLSNIHTTSEMVRDQADKASKLVSAIQGNASRSNILALNASIEAARAGEAGRGFAVVANEMGKLAQVSGSSAKEIDTSLTDIFEAIKKVTDEVTQATEVATAQATETDKIISTLEDIVSWANELSTFVKNS